MEKKIRIALGTLITLSLLAPLNDEWQIVLWFYLKVGTLMTVFDIIPWFFTIYALEQVGFTLSLLATISWFFALPVLFIWNFFQIKPRTVRARKLYHIWLLFSLISSLYISFSDKLNLGNILGVSYWANPILLIIALTVEIWIWDRKRD